MLPSTSVPRSSGMSRWFVWCLGWATTFVPVALGSAAGTTARTAGSSAPAGVPMFWCLLLTGMPCLFCMLWLLAAGACDRRRLCCLLACFQLAASVRPPLRKSACPWLQGLPARQVQEAQLPLPAPALRPARPAAAGQRPAGQPDTNLSNLAAGNVSSNSGSSSRRADGTAQSARRCCRQAVAPAADNPCSPAHQSCGDRHGGGGAGIGAAAGRGQHG